MSNESPTNTPTSTSRPDNGECLACGAETKPYLRPALWDFPARWIPARDICDACEDKQEAAAKLKADQDRIESAFVSAMITPRFRERTFESFAVTPENEKAYEIARHFQVNGDGLMFYGDCGLGKTHLAAAIANSFIGKIPVLYVSAPDLLAEIRSSMNKQGSSDRMELAKRVSLLVLDDIGAEKPSEWVSETLFVLINHRYEHKLSTIFTTNCSLAELEERLGPRIASRIAEMCRLLKMDGTDHRISKPDWKARAAG